LRFVASSPSLSATYPSMGTCVSSFCAHTNSPSRITVAHTQCTMPTNRNNRNRIMLIKGQLLYNNSNNDNNGSPNKYVNFMPTNKRLWVNTSSTFQQPKGRYTIYISVTTILVPLSLLLKQPIVIHPTTPRHSTATHYPLPWLWSHVFCIGIYTHIVIMSSSVHRNGKSPAPRPIIIIMILLLYSHAHHTNQ